MWNLEFLLLSFIAEAGEMAVQEGRLDRLDVLRGEWELDFGNVITSRLTVQEALWDLNTQAIEAWHGVDHN